MYLYGHEDRYDSKTGKKVGTTRVRVGVICDFTGREAEYEEDLGPTYELNYSSLDPCAGDGHGEYDFSRKHNVNVHDFLFGSPYIFDDNAEDENTVVESLMNAVKEEGMDRMYFDHLFRWSRIRTADRLLSEGKYTKDQLGMEHADYGEYEED